MRNKIRIIILIIIFAVNITAVNAIEEYTIKKGDVLSLADCVAIAINNSPIIRKYEYNLHIADSNLGIAKSVYFPTVGVGTGVYQEYNSNKYDENGSSYRQLPSAGVYLQQLIWDFGKSNSLIRMERFYKLAAEYEFMDSICNTIYRIKLKYFNVLYTQAVLETEKTNVAINKMNVCRTKKLYESGQKSKMDYIEAKVFLSDANLRLSAAENDYNIALTDLANEMYSAYSPDFSIRKISTFNYNDAFVSDIKESDSNIKNVAFKTKIEQTEDSKFKELPFNMEEAFKLAYANSPDLWVLEAVQNAMKQALTYAKRQYYPAITGNIGYNYFNYRHDSNNNLNMYLNMSTAMNIKQFKHETERAKANLNLADNSIYEFKQNLYFEVKRSFLIVENNKSQVLIAKQQAEEALEDYNFANKRYEENKTDYIAFQQARKNYNDSKLQYIKRLYEYNNSLANLEIAMHYHFDDLHAQAEHALHYHYKDIIDKLEASMHCEHREEEEKNTIKEKL